jgi:acetylornithine/N-succinyldiaminopimelate aminotransferase
MSNQHDQDQLIAVAARVLMQNYRQQPAVMRRGSGCELEDVAGRRYLDMTAGISVCALGHSHPALQRILAEQGGRLQHVSNLYFVEEQILAAQALAERCFGDRVFFCNSGSEANEAALKLARRYAHVVEGQGRDLVVATDGSFHGRSFATVAVTGQPKYHEGFGPLLQPVASVPFGDLEAARRALGPRSACAFIVEPIQAEGGIRMPPAGYLAGLRELCDETGTLLIFDEVQTGIGRTGRWFGHQHDGVTPDVMTLAKALGGGVPIGAVVATERAAAGLAFVEGGAVPHASTFGGNPLACAAARTVIATIESEGLLDHCARAGEHLAGRLSALAATHAERCEGARGRGLLQGLVLREPAAPVVAACRERGLLLSVAGGTVVRFAPPLIVTTEQLDQAVDTLEQVLGERS